MNRLEILKKYFVGNKKAYIQKYETWISIKQSIFKALQDHIDHKIIIGSYPIYQFNHIWRCRWVCLDIDIHDNFSKKEFAKLEKLVNIVISRPKEFFKCKSQYIIKEKSRRGFHIWIVLKKHTTLKQTVDYLELIRPKLKKQFQDIEFFPKQKIMKEKDLGNAVKLPFNKFSDLKRYIINELNIIPIITEYRKRIQKLRDNKPIPRYKKDVKNTLFPIYNILGKGQKIHDFSQKNIAESVFFDFLNHTIAPQCIKNVILGIYQCNGSNGNAMRVAVATKLLGHFTPEIVATAFSNQKDYDYEKSLYYTRKIQEKGYKDTHCKTIYNLGFCDSTCWRCGSCEPEITKREIFPQKIKGWDGLLKKINKLINSEKKTPKFLKKTTRSGTTTSVIIEAIRNKKKLLMIAPTKLIYEKTLKEAIEIGFPKYFFNAPKTYRIKSNFDTCKTLKKDLTQKEIQEINSTFPFLLKPKCEKCNFKTECLYQKFLKNIDTYDIIYITTQKLNAIMKSPEKNFLLEKLENWCDIIFVDEFNFVFDCNYNSEVIYDDKKELFFIEICRKGLELFLLHKPLWKFDLIIEYINDFLIWLEKNFETLKEQNKPLLLQKQKKEIDEINKFFYNNPKEWCKIYSVFLRYFKDTKNISLRHIIKVFLTLNSHDIYLQQLISIDKNRKIILASVYNVNKTIEWLKDISKKKLLLITDAVKPAIDIHEIFDNLEEININDPMETAKQQTIVVCRESDPTHKFTKRNNADIQTFIEKYGNQNTFLITRSIETKNVIERYKDYEYSQEFGYFRGSKTIGISSEKRNMLIVGSPQPPTHSFDYIAWIFMNKGYFKDFKNHLKLGQYLENHNARSCFFQALSRVKDPYGKEKSMVFSFGLRKNIIENYLYSLGVSVPKIITEKEYKLNKVL